MKRQRKPRRLLPACIAAAALGGCGSVEHALPHADAGRACAGMNTAHLAALFPAANTSIQSAVLQPATTALPEHCVIDGRIAPRTGAGGQPYSIRFRLRLPTAWNHRFYMQGGGGTNGTLVDPTAILARGYATIGTDSGHDNTVNNDPAAGGTGAFGVDPQARIDFAYNAYDQVARTGKALLRRYYGASEAHSYFQGCSEGGREAMLMSQRFPTHFDGIIAGDPVIHLPLGPMSGIYTTQLFAGLAQRAGLQLPNGQPAIGRSYSDADLLLVRNAVLGACDALDGLADGSVDNLPACTTPRVHDALLKVQCTGAKTEACLTADQIGTLEKAYAGVTDSQGRQLYADWPWDAGMTATADGHAYSQNWRSWWLGSATGAANNATKLNYVSAIAVTYSSQPQLPFTPADVLPFSLAYDFDRDPAKLHAATAAYPQSAASLYFTDSTDLSAFAARGGKLMVYHGAADSSVSVNDTLHWYHAMSHAMGARTQDFARMFVVPGMNHCSGGPATDRFDMLPQLVQWVEQGQAPDRVLASASNPGYFGAAARTRPLCPYPQQARYLGSGDVNDAANFACRNP